MLKHIAPLCFLALLIGCDADGDDDDRGYAAHSDAGVSWESGGEAGSGGMGAYPVAGGSGAGAAGSGGASQAGGGEPWPQPMQDAGVAAEADAFVDEGEAGAGGEEEGEAGGAGEEAPVDPEWRENDFVSTEEDNLATFSIDTDTASYARARGAILGGYRPTPQSIRTEEFINYFSYADARHTEGAPFRVYTEVAPSPFGEELHMLRVSLKGREVNPDLQRPSNLVFLVDVSGSMSDPSKLGLIKHTLINLVEALDDTDTISLITYAGSDRIVLRPTPAGDEDAILSAIDGLSSGGGTNGASGILTAYEMAEAAYIDGGNNRVILCTDGDFNVGLYGDRLVDLVASWRDRGVMLSVLGVGADLNDSFLEELTNNGDGTYHFLDSLSEAERVVEALATGILEVIAKEVKIQVELNPEAVARYRLVGYENRDIADEDFRDDTVDAGEISSGHQVTAFLEVELNEMTLKDDAIPLATVRVRYKAPDALVEDPAVEIAHVQAASETLEDAQSASAAFRFGAAVVEFAEVLRESMHVASPDLGAVYQLAAGAAEGLADREELLTLVERAQALIP